MSTSTKANRSVGRAAKSNERSIEAGDDSEQILQAVEDRQGTKRKLLSIEAIDLLFPELCLQGCRARLSEPVTNRQLRFLDQLNVEPNDFDKRLATKFLNHVRARRELGLASINQLRVLTSLGVSDLDYVTFEQAQHLIRDKLNLASDERSAS